jgi:hypothetical protein
VETELVSSDDIRARSLVACWDCCTPSVVKRAASATPVMF